MYNIIMKLYINLAFHEVRPFPEKIIFHRDQMAFSLRPVDPHLFQVSGNYTVSVYDGIYI